MNKAYLLLLFISFNALAQSHETTISVKDETGNPVVAATVVLREKAAKNIQLSNFTDTTGAVNFRVNNYGTYVVKVTSIGFVAMEKEVTINAKQLRIEIILKEDNTNLAEVTIVAKRPMMRQEDDKTIIDPEALADVSTNALEILEKTPGLFVDQDGNVYLNSATPATIYINGREQKMSAADVATILRSLPPNSIEKMEVMRTPSASMDAASAGGSVNIVLKKGVKIGRTGSVNGGFAQGNLGNQFISANISNSLKNRSTFLNVNLSKRNNFDASGFTRFVQNGTQLSTNSYATFPGYSIFLNGGVNVDFTPKWEFSYDARLSFNQNKSDVTNESTVSQTIDVEKVLSKNVNNVENSTNGVSLSQGVFSKYKFDDKGSEIKVDLSLNLFNNDGHQDYATNFTIPTLRETRGFGDFTNKRVLFAAQADFKYYLPNKFTTEAGLKTTVQNFENDTQYKRIVNDAAVTDNFRTTGYTYFENINAAYVQAAKTFGAFIIKAGTRLENTVMRGNQVIPTDTTFKLNRTDLFPYLYLSRKVITIASYDLRAYLVARRTIKRPTYDDLNPFARFVDQYIYETGNPSLQPQFTTNYEANISFQEYPIFAVGRNYTTDIFTNVVYQDKTNPLVSYRTTDNLGKNRETYFRVLGAVPPGGKYFFVIGTQFSKNEYDGILDDKPFTFNRASWTFFTYHQLKLDKFSTFTLNGFLRTKGQLQFYELGNFGTLSLGLNRQFFDRKLVVTLSANDILYSNQTQFTLNQGNINGFGTRRSDSRRFGLNARYSFGSKKKPEQGPSMNFGDYLKE